MRWWCLEKGYTDDETGTWMSTQCYYWYSTLHIDKSWFIVPTKVSIHCSPSDETKHCCLSCGYQTIWGYSNHVKICQLIEWALKAILHILLIQSILLYHHIKKINFLLFYVKNKLVNSKIKWTAAEDSKHNRNIQDIVAKQRQLW